jgi:hypothetical protein
MEHSESNATAIAVHPDVFTPEEAVAYLKMPSLRCFNNSRRRHNIKATRFGREIRYSREELDALRKKLFGLDFPARSRKAS